MMIKFLLAFLLVSSSLATFANKQCLSKATQTFKSIKNILSMDLNNKKIDQITNTINSLPATIGVCLGEQAQETFSEQVPALCVADLNKAAKLALKLQNEKDNQLLFSKDLILLERHFQTKCKKSCPFLTDITLQDIKDSATCLQASYRFSLLVQKLGGDINKGDKKAIVSDFNLVATQLPGVLDTCGQTQWANEVRKYLPMDCIHAVEDFVSELAVVQHHYTHFEWIAKNYKDIEAYVKMVQMHCPIFN